MAQRIREWSSDWGSLALIVGSQNLGHQSEDPLLARILCEESEVRVMHERGRLQTSKSSKSGVADLNWNTLGHKHGYNAGAYQ